MKKRVCAQAHHRYPNHGLANASRLLMFLGLLGAASGHGQALRTQSISLQPGWNAVFLEIDPLVAEPALLFHDEPVDIVAAHAAPRRSAQFVSNPRADMLSAYGWAVWYAPGRPDAFLSRLYALQGASAYLMHSTTNTVLEIEGRVPLTRPNWTPDAYNFVGFTVQSPGSPTFHQFFEASPAHNHNRIYRLVNGTWRQVLDPSAATLRPGEAFWIHCRGRSDYAGPLQVAVPSVFGLTVSSQSDSEIVFRNRTAHPLTFTLEHLTAGNDPIPLSATLRAVDDQSPGFRNLSVPFAAGDWIQDFPPLEAGAALRLPLALRLAEAQPGVRHSLLRVRTDLGTETYIAVTASRDDLP